MFDLKFNTFKEVTFTKMSSTIDNYSNISFTRVHTTVAFEIRVFLPDISIQFVAWISFNSQRDINMLINFVDLKHFLHNGTLPLYHYRCLLSKFNLSDIFYSHL